MNTPSRRRFLKLGGSALALIPVLAVSSNAFAAKNAGMRSALKYQDKPGPDGKDCAGCMHYLAKQHGCEVLTGDSEIAPKGYCMAWIKKA